ncbi:MAG: peptidase S41 [Porticoccaceae bacterium]|nr:peptidase S41 [Porticoccaceae bacterium]
MKVPVLGVLICLLFTAGATLADEAGQTQPAEARLPLEELQLFAQIFDQVRSAYVEEIDDRELLEKAITGLLGELDPHSAFLQQDSYAELKEHTTGEFGGLGIEVGLERGYVRVISPIDDTPAARAGLRPGDLILKLDERSTQGMSLDEAVSRMRGAKGTSITLTIGREGVSEPLTLTIVRDIITVQSVRWETLEPGYGYVRIAQFQEQTGGEFRSALEELRDGEPGLKGLILDLRNNPGGLLPASVEVADTLLDGGLIVYTKGRIASANTKSMATAGEFLAGVPVVVLINEGTASAAEIVAGALQDRQRALIIGTRSFGKGSVQNVLPIGDGRAVKLTTARYFTPGGHSIQAEGIRPDIEVRRAEIHELEPGFTVKEADLSGHLSGAGDQGAAPRREAEPATPADNQLQEALNLLKALVIFVRQEAKSDDS